MVSNMNSPDEPSDILTLAEAAKFLRMSEETVRNHARDGVIPGRKVGQSDRSHWRFSQSRLSEWVRGEGNA